jgi:hypothetical protein
MRFLIRNTVFFILTAIILLLNITCAEPKDDTEASPYLGNTLSVTGEQVWMPNYNTGKVSQMLLKFAGDRTVDVIVELITGYIESVGSGKIEKGILSFHVDVMNDSDLLDSDELLILCFNEWYLDKDGIKNIFIDTTDVKGNIITLVALYQDDSNEIPVEGVIREGFSGTKSSLTGEYIYYVYVNKDCKITTAKEVKKTELDWTYNKLELSLKAGWNTICKSETYTTTGDSSYSMTVKNPSINWVIQKMK